MAPTLCDMPDEIILSLGLKLHQAPTRHIRKLLLRTYANNDGIRRMRSLGKVSFDTRVNKQRLWFGPDQISMWTAMDTSTEPVYLAFLDPTARLPIRVWGARSESPGNDYASYAIRLCNRVAINVDPWMYTLERPDHTDIDGVTYLNLNPVSKSNEFAGSLGLLCVSLKLVRGNPDWTIEEAAASFSVNESDHTVAIVRLHLLPIRTDCLENLRVWSII